MSQPLLIYFSRSGNTRRLADTIAADLDCTSEEIRDLIPHKGFFGYFRSGYEAIFHKPCPIGASVHDPSAHDLVLIGTPNWGSNASSPVQAWLSRHEGKIGAYAVFVTQGGSGGEKVIDQIEGMIGHPPVASMVVSEADLASGHARMQAHEFLHGISAARASGTG